MNTPVPARNAQVTRARPGPLAQVPPGGSVRVLPAVVLEDEPDRREQDEEHPD